MTADQFLFEVSQIPEANDAVLRAIVWQKLTPVIILFIATMIMVFVHIKIKNWFNYTGKDRHFEIYSSIIVAVLLIDFCLLLGGCIVYFDPRTWMGIFDPEAYLVAEVLKNLNGPQ